jgi:hypothetical protein
MPKVTFLEADQPLAKSYSLDSEGKLQKESYPRVWEFTSHSYDYKDLTELCDLLRGAAAKGWCLLKGDLQRDLINESRAGSTDPNSPTDTIVLDFDRLGRILSIEEAMGDLGLGNYSHIVQYSASHGVEPEKGCTAHVILKLSAPAHPASLKQWLISLNLKVEALNEVLRLTRTHNAISWGLDVSTCQNDKLIYIAPPRLGEGVKTTFTAERIQLVTKSIELLDPSTLIIPTAEVNRVALSAKLEELRSKIGLLPRSWNVRNDKHTGLEVLSKPDASTLTGIRRERGFVYFNLNGGDSWGYFHPESSPEVIRNFKGEPNYLTSELLPEYWSQVQLERAARAIEQHQIKANLESGIIDPSKKQILVFRDFKTAIYYNGSWDPDTQHLQLARASSELQLQHFLVQNGLPEIDSIPVWNLIFDPQSDVRVDVRTRTLNTFEPSKYMKQAYEPVDTVPPIIRRVIQHAVAYDPELEEHWLNWFACIYRLRLRTMIAWILHGIQGTGKGLMLNKILIPLLGIGNVAVRRMAELDDRFNAYLESAMLTIIDEAEISEAKGSQLIMASLKNQITEPQVSIRRMHAAAYTVPNYCNFMFFSNKAGPVTIEITDRRFNVGEFRQSKLQITDAEIDAIEGELSAFANYLMTREVSAEKARSVLATTERAEMIATSQNSVETTAQALLAGDLEFFWDALPAGDMGVLSVEQQMLHDAYTRLILDALRAEDGMQRLTRDETRALFAYNIGKGVPNTPAKFTQLLRHHRIQLKPLWIKGRTTRGVEANWKTETAWKQERLKEFSEKAPTLRVVGD